MQGHCLCRRVNDIHCPDRITKCDRWEYNADCRKQKIKSIKQTLENIEITVRMIAETLTDEELLYIKQSTKILTTFFVRIKTTALVYCKAAVCIMYFIRRRNARRK